MIHLTNAQLVNALHAACGPENERTAESTVTNVLTLSRLATALGLKTATESIFDLMKRLEQPDSTFNLMNEKDHNFFMELLMELYAPFSGKRFLIVALSDDSSPVITQMQSVDDPRLSIESIQNIFRFLSGASASNVIDL